MLSVAVTVTLKLPATVGVPTILALAVCGTNDNVSPLGRPAALQLQHVAPIVTSLAVNTVAGYGTVISPLGRLAGGVTVICPFATPPHTISAASAHPHWIENRFMAESNGAG